MDFFKDIASKAHKILDNASGPKKLSKDEQLRRNFKLPDTETIIGECLAELSISTQYQRLRIEMMKKKGTYVDGSATFNGNATLTDNYFVFRDSYNSIVCSFVLELPMVQRIQRVHRAYDFSIALTTTNGLEMTVKFIGIKSQCELFGQKLISQLRECLPEVDRMTEFRTCLYSEYLLSKNHCNTLTITTAPEGGLGWIFKFPGNAQLLNDRLKMKKWFDYFRENGRNFALVRGVQFYKLVSYGLPNKLRGEIWETCCGSIYLRYRYDEEYSDILAAHEGEKSLAIEEIEKDLNRSLPEYPAYQTPEGINRLRRVLTAYSWKNPEVGYCQAMNIVTAAMLIFMSEEQTFWCLNVLCDKIIPGYYSKTMYGVLLDQKVFEALIHKTMPLIAEHCEQQDIQLSIVSLPWFLSFFLNSMPLIYGFRVVDMMLLHGSRVLFQVSLGVLRVNGEKLLACEDDGESIAVFKEYFATLEAEEPSLFHPNKVRPRFDNLWEVAFREFAMIDDTIIKQLRHKYTNEVFQGIETFVKRAEIRNLPTLPNLTMDQLSNIYDRYYSVLLRDTDAPPDRGGCTMDFESFVLFMAELVDWVDAHTENIQQTKFLKRLAKHWSTDEGVMTLETLAQGIDRFVDRDIMHSLSNFIALYDDKGNGHIDKATVLEIAEELIYLTTPWREGHLFDDITNAAIESEIAKKIVQRREALKKQGIEVAENDITLPDEVRFNEQKWQGKQQERFLASGSNFLRMAFQYAQPEEDPEKPLIDLEDDEEDEKKRKKKDSITHNVALDPTHPIYITPSTFRMIVLADETYESFFRTQFWKSFHVDEKIDQKAGVVDNIRGMFNNFLADGRRVAVEVRKRMDEANKVRSNSESGSTEGDSKRSRASSSLIEEDEDDFGNFVGPADEDLNDIPVGGNEMSVLHDTKELDREKELAKSLESTHM